MSARVETVTTTTKKQKLNNGSPLSTMSVQNPTPSPAPATPAPTTPAPATNGVQTQAQAQWAQIPIDPALQNAQPYPQYAWPPQPTGAPAPVASPAPSTATSSTPQPIRPKTSTPAPTSISPAPNAATTTATAPAPATTTAPYAAPYYAAAPGYRYPYPYQGQPQYAYTYAQAPGGQYYAVPQPVPQPQAQATTATTGTTTPATPARVVMPTAAAASSTAQAVAGVGQPMQGQQPTSALNDALAGIVDLRAEEDALARSHQDVGSAYYHREGDRSKRIAPALEQSKLWMSERLKAILFAQGLKELPEDALNYAMLAWKARLQLLWDKALSAAEHRTSSQYSRPPSFWNPPPADGTTSNSTIPPTPMWSTVIKRDVGKQLSALERAEKEEETRARRERRAATAQAEADDAVDDDLDADGRKAKKMRALGPGVTARMMPEDVKKKMSDNTANRAAGLGTGKYAWMTAGAAGGGAASAPKPKPVVTPAATPAASTGAVPAAAAPGATAITASAAPPAGTPAKAGGWGRAYAAVSKTTAGQEVKDDGITVTLRDTLFIASRERGFGAGRGSALASAGKWE